jgi:phytoene dehydrogenase-like protein
LQYWFDSEFLKAPLARLASEFGAPPSQKTISIGSMMMSMRHNPGMARPRGGTGALTKALLNLVTEKGGVVLCDRAVETVLISNEGKAEGVRTTNGAEYRAKTAVISNIDARRLFLNLIPVEASHAGAPNLRERLDRRIVNNNETILKIDCALDELKNQVADRVINKLADYAPNVKDSMIARRVESPAELGERLGAYKGNYYHMNMTLDQMVFFRPLPEIANYTTPIDGDYI